MDSRAVARAAADLPAHAVSVEVGSVAARGLHNMRFAQALARHDPGALELALVQMQREPGGRIRGAYRVAAGAKQIVEGKRSERDNRAINFAMRLGDIGMRRPWSIVHRAVSHAERREDTLLHQLRKRRAGRRCHRLRSHDESKIAVGELVAKLTDRLNVAGAANSFG